MEVKQWRKTSLVVTIYILVRKAKRLIMLTKLLNNWSVLLCFLR